MSLPFAFVSVILIWSTTPLAIKWSAVDVHFSFAVLARMLIGALLCALLLMMLRIRFPWHRSARLTYLAGGLTLFGAMSLTYWSAPYVNSGLISVLFGLSPLITGLGAAYWLQERTFTRSKVVGMLLGLAGLALVFQTSLNVGHDSALGMLVLLGAVTVQSLGLVWIKRIGDHSSPVAINLGALVVSLPLFGLVWLVSDGHWPPQIMNRAGAAILYLGVFGSVVGFVLYYYMIKHLATAKVALITLITPVIALLLGHGLNGEAIPSTIWSGTACILLGLSVHQWGERLRRPRFISP